MAKRCRPRKHKIKFDVDTEVTVVDAKVTPKWRYSFGDAVPSMNYLLELYGRLLKRGAKFVEPIVVTRVKSKFAGKDIVEYCIELESA